MDSLELMMAKTPSEYRSGNEAPWQWPFVFRNTVLKQVFVGWNYFNDLIPFWSKLDIAVYTIENRKVVIFLFADGAACC